MELLRPLSDSAYGAKTVAYTGTAGTTSTWPPGPQGVLVWCTSDAYIRVTTAGTAASSVDTPIPAGTPVAFYAPQAGTEMPWSVSAVQITTGGTLYAKPINIR